MRRWVVVVLAGVTVLAVGGVMLAVGLDTADKVGSVIGAVCGMVGLGISTYGLIVARSADQRTAPETQTSVANSVPGSSVTGDVTQVGSVSRDLVTGGTNFSGVNPMVAGSGGTIIGRVESIVLPTSAASAEPLPAPRVELCIGRDEQIDAVTTAWRAGQWAVVVGGPGIGKSTLLGRAIGLDVIVTAFRDRRFVVSCDGANTAGAVIDKLATVFGVGLGEHLRNRMVSFLRAAPCVLVLDNFETVTDADPGGAAELLTTLRAIRGLVVGIGSRGAHVPTGFVGSREIKLGPLSRQAAVDVFKAVVGDRHRADPALQALMADLDGVPLAIVLMASLARTESDLDTLSAAWRAKRTDLLQHGAMPDRTSSLPVSIELSWDQLSPDGHVALSLAALLPDGWPRSKAGMYLPDELAAGVIELSHRALLHDDELRQRCLAPLRQHVLKHHPPDSAQIGLLAASARMLTTRAAQVGCEGGAEATTDIATELTNLIEIIRATLPDTSNLGNAVADLLDFQRFTGLGDDQIGVDVLSYAASPTSRAENAAALARLYITRSDNEKARALLDQSLSFYQRVGSPLGEAECLRNLGELAFRESDNEQARALFSRALSLCQRVGSAQGEANCLRPLGELAFIESDNERARALLDQALPLYQRVADVLGEANCLRNLGQLAFRESDNKQARALLDQALPLYQRAGSPTGEANCLRPLGELALRESDNKQAHALFSRALSLYQRVGSPLGEADCLRNLGELALRESDNEQARALFSRAISLYQRAGSPTGEADCLRNLGELALRESDNEQARALFNQALPVYQRIHDRYSAAITHAWLTRATDNEQHIEHKSQMDRLTTELNMPGFDEWLRAIAEG